MNTSMKSRIAARMKRLNAANAEFHAILKELCGEHPAEVTADLYHKIECAYTAFSKAIHN